MAGVTFCRHKNSLAAYLSGEIDHHSAQLLREKIDGETIRISPELLILDFSNVSFMDSSGISLVLGRMQRIRRQGGTIRVINAPEQVVRVLRLAGICSEEAFK